MNNEGIISPKGLISEDGPYAFLNENDLYRFNSPSNNMNSPMSSFRPPFMDDNESAFMPSFFNDQANSPKVINQSEMETMMNTEDPQPEYTSTQEAEDAESESNSLQGSHDGEEEVKRSAAEGEKEKRPVAAEEEEVKRPAPRKGARSKKRDLKSYFKKHSVLFIQEHTVEGFIIKYTIKNGRKISDNIILYKIPALEDAFSQEINDIFTRSWKTCEKEKARKIIIGALYGNRPMFPFIDKAKVNFEMDLTVAYEQVRSIKNKIVEKMEAYGITKLSA